MNTTIIRRWNERVKPQDTVYHLGDFCFRSGQQGNGTPSDYWSSQLNGKIIHVRGNHDKNNGTNSILKRAGLNLGKYIAIAVHEPFENTEAIPFMCNLILCGHVHEKWKEKWIGNIPMINVGVDVWNFYPIRMDEIIGYYEQIRQQRNLNYE
jgi:calcineurin-like phosphoesterase family protein